MTHESTDPTVTTWAHAPAHARPFSVEVLPFEQGSIEHAAQEGMSKREVMATTIFAAMLGGRESRDAVTTGMTRQTIAAEAVEAADALIAALNAKPFTGKLPGYGENCDHRR